MPAFPSTESILLHVRQAAGVPLNAEALSPKNKAAFADLGLPANRQIDVGVQLLGEIVGLLDLDARSAEYFMRHLGQWGNHHKTLELDTWTFGASDRQILWTLLSRSIVPTLARVLAWWDLDGALAADMPRGEFWFLPTIAPESGRLALPLPKVLAWLVDLYGTSASKYQEHLGRRESDVSLDSRLRTLYNWMTGSLPHADTIIRMFPDTESAGDAQVFKGAFVVDPATSPSELFRAALAFVQRKALDAPALARQIGFLDVEHLGGVLAGQGSEAEQARFVHALRVRYTAPTPHAIRQRLLVARAVQSGYDSLVEFLCPDVKADCTDPARNKVLQLVGLFKRVFKLTVTAHNQAAGAGQDEEDRLFEAAMTPYERGDLLLAIAPSKVQVAPHLVPVQWARRFERMSPDDALEDLAPTGPDQVEAFVQRVMVRSVREDDEDRRIGGVLDRARNSSPWRAMQDQSFDVLRRIIHVQDAPQRLRQLACERLVEVAATTEERAEAALSLAINVLARDVRQRPTNAELQVDELLAQARAAFDGGHHEPLLSNAEAKQLLFKGRLKDAKARFRDALEACSSAGCGRLRGEIARDLLALEVADTPLPTGAHTRVDKYYRNMIAFGMFEGEPASLEATAVWAHAYFWDDLYRPYRNAPSIRRPETVDARKTLAKLAARLSTDETIDWKAWLADHRKAFAQRRLADVRGDSVLTFFLKALPRFVAAGDGHTPGRIRDFQRALIEAWPSQVALSDFKGQTPLMLAADQGEAELVGHLLRAGAPVDEQDYLGRTALHAAVTARSPECVQQLLAVGPDTGKVTFDESQSVLHTAVRVGDVRIAGQLVYAMPELRGRLNDHGRTPAQELQHVVEHHAEFARLMLENHRAAPSVSALQEIAVLLRG